MDSEFFSSSVSSIAQGVIERLLNLAEPNVVEVKEIVINGNTDTIHTIIHFYKSQKLMERLTAKFKSKQKNVITLDKEATIVITDEFGNNITDQVLEYEHIYTLIPYKELFKIPGERFIIQVDAPFRAEYNSLFLIDREVEPVLNTKTNLLHRCRLYVYQKKYISNEIRYLNIPFSYPILIDFIKSRFIKPLELKSLDLLKKAKSPSRRYNETKKKLAQKWGFDPDDLSLKIRAFMRKLEEKSRVRFSEFMSVSCQDTQVRLTKLQLEFERVQQTLPVFHYIAKLSFNYHEGDDNEIEIDININKEKLNQIVDKIWSKIKKPLRTAPKKLKKKK